MRIPRIHLHLFRELAFVFALSLTALLALLLIGRMLQLRELFLTQSLGLAEIAQLFAYLTPFFMLLLMPVACMLAVFLTFLRMASDNELLALKSGGVSLYQLLPAPVVFCVLAALLNFAIAHSGLSWGMDQFRDKVVQFARTKTQLLLQPGVINREFPGLTLFAEQVDPNRGEMKLVFVRDETRPGIQATIVAPEGRTVLIPDEAQFRIVLKYGHIYRREGDKLDVLGFDTYAVKLDLNQIVQSYRFGEVKPKELSLRKLESMAADPTLAQGQDENFVRKVEVEIQKRYALPVSCLVLGLFALPFACAFTGLRQQYGLILALGFFLIYYTLLSLGFSLGETGTLSPVVGLWLPNLLFSLAGLVNIRLTARERGPRIMDWIHHLRRMRRPVRA